MDNNWITKNVSEDYVRTIYNVFINSALEANNTVNRTFTSFDLFPTILASMGVSIDGDRLGLGTNLFSNRLTLSEELGFNYLHSELKKIDPEIAQKLTLFIFSDGQGNSC